MTTMGGELKPKPSWIARVAVRPLQPMIRRSRPAEVQPSIDGRLSREETR